MLHTKHQQSKPFFSAFTLVELIVVIVILAILATIAFLSFNSYSASSRDSVRLSDINSLKKSLEMYNITGGVGYPLPDSNTGVTFSGAILWYQGTIGDGVSRILSTNLSKKPIDPLINNEYTYSLLGNKREFQIKANLESGKIGYNNINGNNGVNNSIPHLTSPNLGEELLSTITKRNEAIQTSSFGAKRNGVEEPAYRQAGLENNSSSLLSNVFNGLKDISTTLRSAQYDDIVNAASTGATTCYINGNFNGLLDSTKDSSNTNYILAVPSLILTDPTNTSNTTFTGGNLSKMGSGILQCNGQNDPCVINYNSSNIIYTGTPTTTTQALTIAQNLQQAYSGSNITTLPAVQNILTSTGDALTNISAGVLKNSVGVSNLQDCPMGDDWNGSSCVPDSKTLLLLHFDNTYNNSGLSTGGNLGNVGTVFTGGYFGGAASFNGSTNYIDISGGSSPGIYSFGTNTDFTIDFWVNRKAAQQGRFFDLSGTGLPSNLAWNSSNGIERYVYSDASGNCGYQQNDGAGNPGNSISCGTIPVNIWTHIAVTRSGNIIRAFMNGTLISTITQTSYGVIPTKQLRIGRTVGPAAQNFNGYMDEIRISKGAARWTSDFTPPTRAY